MNEKETLDTPAKMQAFWLFAHDQGNKHWKAREHIARLSVNVIWKWHTYLNSVMPYEEQRKHLEAIKDEWSTNEYIGESPYPQKLTDREYSDQCWQALEINLELSDITKR